MKCPICESTLSLKSNRCDRCGADTRVYKKIVKASNSFYNQGLRKAKVRDLTGAANDLRQSLQLDKRNTNARNLLGLVYYEMGETVSALSEWVLSKHFQPEDNDADEYMSSVQSNPSKLETLNQAIKKYNSSLISAKQHNSDLAIIQLKKVISLNPKFLRAYHLLALLYINEGEKDKAYRLLLKASAIDVNNTTTLRYLKEVMPQNAKAIPVLEAGNEEKEPNTQSKSEFNVFSGMASYKEDKPNIWAYLNLVIGIVVGICFCFFLIVPQIESSKSSESQEQLQVKNERISTLETENSSLKNTNKELQGKVDELTKDLADANKEPVTTPPPTTAPEPGYDKLFEAASLLLENKEEEAALALTTVVYENLKLQSAKDLYDYIKNKTFADAASDLYRQGKRSYDRGKYQEAITFFEQSVALKSDQLDSLFFMGRSYHRLNEIEKAKEFYNLLVNEYATTSRGRQAALQLGKLD